MLRTHRLHSFLTALVLLSVHNLRAATYVQTVLDAGPAAYWRFESVNDTSLVNGYVNAFQSNATVTADGGGVPLNGVANNRALLLDGNGDSVRTGVSNQLTFASSGTFMAWVNFNQLPSEANRTVELIVKSHFGNALDWVMDSNNRLFGYAGDYLSVFYDFNPALAANTWYHLAFTFDNADGGFKRMYVNGVLVGDQPADPNRIGTDDEILIGNSPVWTDRSLNGRMDEVALFNRALTSTEVQTIFASAGVTTPTPQPVVRLKLEFARVINALDYGGGEYYTMGLTFTMIPAPFNSTNSVYSPSSSFSQSIGGPSGGAFTGGSIGYNTLAEAITEAASGPWTLKLNEGQLNEQVYHFTVSVTDLTPAAFADITITSPVDGSAGSPDNVPFTWTQSKPWLLNQLELYGPTYANTSVPPGATTWTGAPLLNLGRHDFYLTLRTNAATWVNLTTPINATSQPLANWDSASQLNSRRGIRFRVGYFIPPPPGLQAHLRFDDENWLGKDSSGNGNDANVSWYDQPPTYNADGNLNGAASFTQGGWLEFNDAFTPTLGGDFTVAVWVQTTQVAGNDDDQGIYGAGIVAGYIYNYNGQNTTPIVLNGSKAGFMTANGSGEQTLHSTADINTGGPGWVHVAVTRVQATGEKRLYINGVLNASETGNTDLLSDTEPVRVGYGDYITFNGKLDDLQIYSAALSTGNITALYANPGEVITDFNPPGLQAHLQFDDLNSLGTDSSGKGNHASEGWDIDPPIYDETGKTNGAASFSQGGWLEFPDTLTPSLSADFTVAVWVQTTQMPGSELDQGNDGAGIVGGHINDYHGRNTIPLALNGSKAGFMTSNQDGPQTLHSTLDINTGDPVWVHLAITRVRATGEKRIYINGVLDASATGNTDLLTEMERVRVGFGDFATFNGLLDDLQIYNAALSAADIAYLYANPGATIANVGASSGGHANVAHYAFDDSGNLGLDSSGNGNDASVGSTWGPVHQFAVDAEAGGGAAQFFGTSALGPNGQALANLNAVLSGSFTFSAWVKTTVTTGTDNDNAFYGAVIFWAYNDHENTNDTIPLAITGSKAAFTTRDHLGNFDTLHSTTSVNDGNYHLITVTRNQATGEKRIYVDGSFEASEIGTTEPLNGNNYNLAIGGWAYCAADPCTSFYAYNGLLDDLQIYTGVLSDAEVATLYANPGTTIPDITIGDLVVHHDFDEGTVLAADVSANNNDIVHAGNFGGGGPSVSSDTAAGSGSISFDGGSYLTASPALLPVLAGDFSVSLWLKTSQTYGNQGDLGWMGASVVAADSPNAGAKDLIPVALTGGQVAFNVGDGISDDTLNSSATVNDDAWHHVVVTRSLTTGERQIFIDGTLDSSSVGSTVLLNSPVLLTIGAKSDASDPDPASPDANGSNGYDGLLDDLQMYNRVLSSQEVVFLHQHPGAVVADACTPPTIDSPPVYSETKGQPFKIAESDLLTHVSGSGGVLLLSVAANSANGVALSRGGGWIHYNGNLTADDSFGFTVASTAGGCTTSGTVTINMVTTAGSAQSIAVSGGIVTVNCAGIPGYSYHIQRSIDGMNTWQTLQTTIAPAAGLFIFIDDFHDLGSPPPSAYYRIAQP